MAKCLGAEVCLNEYNGRVEDEETVRRVKTKVKVPWIRWEFSDELADYETLSAIVNAIETDSYDISNMIRKIIIVVDFSINLCADRMSHILKKDALNFFETKIDKFGKVTVDE